MMGNSARRSSTPAIAASGVAHSRAFRAPPCRAPADRSAMSTTCGVADSFSFRDRDRRATSVGGSPRRAIIFRRCLALATALERSLAALSDELSHNIAVGCYPCRPNWRRPLCTIGGRGPRKRRLQGAARQTGITIGITTRAIEKLFEERRPT